MRKITIIVFISLISLWLGAVEITIATGEWKPYTSKDLQNYGFAAEIVTEAYKKEGITVNYEFYPWKRCEASVKEGKVLAAFPYKITDKRKKDFIFSEAIFHSRNLFFYKKGTGNYKVNTIEDLKKYKVGGVMGYFYVDLFKEAGIAVDYAPKEEQTLKKLYNGRVDLYAASEVPAWELIKKIYPNKVDQFATLEKPFDTGVNCLMFSKNNPKAKKYIKLYNNGLKKLKETGEYQKIIDKHNIKISQ